MSFRLVERNGFAKEKNFVNIHERPKDERSWIVGTNFERLIKEFPCFGDALWRKPSHADRPRLKGKTYRIPIVGLALAATPLFGQKREVKGTSDLVFHFIVQIGELRDVATELIRPNLPAGLGIDQLGVDPDRVAQFLNAPFEGVANPQLAADLPHVDRLSFKGRGGAARNHK